MVGTMETSPRARSDGGGSRTPHSVKAKKGTPGSSKKKNNDKLGPDDLEVLVEENPELFEALVEKARKKRAMCKHCVWIRLTLSRSTKRLKVA